MLAFNKLAFLVLVLRDEYLLAVNRVADCKPKEAPRTLKAFRLRHLPNDLGFVPAGGQLLEGPADNIGLWLVRGDEFASVGVGAVDISNRGKAHITAFLSRSTHAVENILRPPIVLYFRGGKVEGQHHFVFRDGEV
ncbi:MAG TPA: hypothetical protein VGS79_27045 [Puia sp.]|nr:hypothetical protein [Puia sp.]